MHLEGHNSAQNSVTKISPCVRTRQESISSPCHSGPWHRTAPFLPLEPLGPLPTARSLCPSGFSLSLLQKPALTTHLEQTQPGILRVHSSPSLASHPITVLINGQSCVAFSSLFSAPPLDSKSHDKRDPPCPVHQWNPPVTQFWVTSVNHGRTVVTGPTPHWDRRGRRWRHSG